MKRVPKKEVPDREGQLVDLLEQLDRHKVFDNCRGRLGGLLRDVRESMGQAESPTAFLRAYDEFCARARVMLNLLAKYKGCGWEFAFRELSDALSGAHIIQGEKFLIKETTPVTILMFEPEITLRMIRWALTHKDEDLEGFFVKRESGVDTSGLDPDLVALFKWFPTLDERVRLWQKSNLRSAWRGNDVFCAAYGDRFRGELNGVSREHVITLRLSPHQQDSVLGNHCQRFAFMFFGKGQAEVLSDFGQDVEHKLATWQLNIPTLFVREVYNIPTAGVFFVGLHPEGEHETWGRRWPAFVSLGCSQGLGAVLLRRTYHPDPLLEVVYPRCRYGQVPEDGVARIVFGIAGVGERW